MSAPPSPEHTAPSAAVADPAAPASIGELLAERTGQAEALPRPLPLGFDPLDGVLGGGLRAGDLALLGGPPGVGKTAVMLQWARALAEDGATAVFVCYEHDRAALLQRLLIQLTAEIVEPGAERLISAAREFAPQFLSGVEEGLESDGLLESARETLRLLGDRLWLQRGSAAHTDLDALRKVVAAVPQPVLIVDYLQKVAVRPEPASEAEKLVTVVSGLKDLAMQHGAVVLAAAACDQAALEGRRARLHHLRGSSSLAYEADIAMMLNHKMNAVSEVHLAYDSVRAESFRNQVVLSVEKNRAGPAMIDMEFTAQLDRFRLHPEGGFVAERLAD